jgi:hypothetical protein
MDADAFGRKVMQHEKSGRPMPTATHNAAWTDNRPGVRPEDGFNFADWCINEEIKELDVLSEIFDANEISSFQPKNGHWSNEPADAPGSYVYYFDVEGDPETCGSDPCYSAVVSYQNGAAYIAFKHANTQYKDRGGEGGTWDKAGADIRKLGSIVMYSVLKALMEFIQKVNPNKLNWSAVSKSRNNANNPGARKKVYFAWAVKNLFPDKYVPTNEQEWWSVNYYNQQKEDDWPEIPQSSGNRAAKTFIQEVASKIREKEEREEREQEEREQEQARQLEARRQQIRDSLPQLLQDPQHNPNGVNVGDITIFNSNFYRHRNTHEIKSIEVSFDDTWDNNSITPKLIAKTQTATGYGSYGNWIEQNQLFVKELKKYEPQEDAATYEVGEIVHIKWGGYDDEYVVKQAADDKGRILVFGTEAGEKRYEYPDNLEKANGQLQLQREPMPQQPQPYFEPDEPDFNHPNDVRNRRLPDPPGEINIVP